MCKCSILFLENVNFIYSKCIYIQLAQLTDQLLHKSSLTKYTHITLITSYMLPKSGNTMLPKGGTDLPEQPSSGSQNCSQNCTVLADQNRQKIRCSGKNWTANCCPVLPELAARNSSQSCCSGQDWAAICCPGQPALCQDCAAARTWTLAVHVYQKNPDPNLSQQVWQRQCSLNYTLSTQNLIYTVKIIRPKQSLKHHTSMWVQRE